MAEHEIKADLSGEALRKEMGLGEAEHVVQAAGFPEYAVSWALKVLAREWLREFDSGTDLPASFFWCQCAPNLASVSDWLAWLPRGRPGMSRRLARLTWSDAVKHAETWHERIARRKVKQTPDDPDGVEPVLQLEAGWQWVRLTTPAALRYETARMGHCVGEGGYDEDVQGDTTRIYSLRDGKNAPHATAEVSCVPGHVTVDQVVGRRNTPVPDKLVGHVRTLYRLIRPTRWDNWNIEFGFMRSPDGRLLDPDVPADADEIRALQEQKARRITAEIADRERRDAEWLR